MRCALEYVAPFPADHLSRFGNLQLPNSPSLKQHRTDAVLTKKH